jgi:ribosomal protein L11 methyltransferase
MEYTLVNCTIQPDNEINREILIAELGSIGFESFSETETTVESYVPSSDFSLENLIKLSHDDHFDFKFHYTIDTIPDQNWNEVWEKNYFKPLLIADKCLIRAPFHTDYSNAEYEIIIEPDMAFGTGNHETTSLMIEEILEENLIGKTVLDMGCGTGILGILAAKKGAKSITSIDIDQHAINSTIKNSQNNCIDNLEVLLGGAAFIPDKKYDIIFANIHRNILINDMHYYINALKPLGKLVMSGFYADDLNPIKHHANNLGLQFERFTERGNWVVAVFTSK